MRHTSFDDHTPTSERYAPAARSPAARNTFQVQTNAPPNPSTMFRFSAYVVDANTVLLVGMDSTRVIVGTLTRQP